MAGFATTYSECDMESSHEELLDASPPAHSGLARRHTFTLVAGVLMMCGAISLWHNPNLVAQVKGHLFIGFDEEVAAASEEGCESLPFVKLTNVVTSNLGNKGPDINAEEGIIYNATAHHTGANVSHLQIHIHSVPGPFGDMEFDEKYEPAFTHGQYVNGIFGKFGIINVKQGQSVMLRAHAYDADTGKDIPLPHSAISFFDLDTGADNNHSVEHVKITGRHPWGSPIVKPPFKAYYVSNETEVDVTKSDNFTVFTATTEGTGEDNPSDPTELTVQQKNRAVTVVFEDTDSFLFEVGASPGKTGRVFSFVFRPSLLCAKTKLADGTLVGAKDTGAPVVPVSCPFGEEEDVKGAAFKDLPSVVLMLSFLSAVMSSFL